MNIKEFKEILEEKRVDFAVFYNLDPSKPNANMLYFSGYGGLGALVIPKSRVPFIIVPQMEVEKAKKSAIKKTFLMEKKKFFESIYKLVKRHGIKSTNIAIDKSSVTLNAYRHIKKQFENSKFKDVSFECLKLREIKTKKEMKFLKRSCSYADKILQKAIKNLKSFKTESEAAAFLEYETKKNGLEPSFNPIVASGSNASMPHHVPANLRVKNGFCVMDFGVKYRGYCSDITRTVYVGKPNEKEKKVYDFLLKIQESAINEIKYNKKCSELYDFINNSLGAYKEYFTHGLGHGVGVEIHELPNLTLNSKDRIINNMAFTIEPGVYFPKRFGIRVEDTILFKNKPIILTRTSKDLLIV